MNNRPITTIVVDAIESAIRSGESQSSIARKSGVHRIAINRFLSGQKDLNLESADRIVSALTQHRRR
jgi:plasmid maintenance system antidote protein VapI